MSNVCEVTYTFSQQAVTDILTNDAEIRSDLSYDINAILVIQGEGDDKPFYVPMSQLKEIRLVLKPQPNVWSNHSANFYKWD